MLKFSQVGRLTASGDIEPIPETPDLPLGLRIFAYGGYGEDMLFAVSGPRNERGEYPAVRMTRYYEGTYFSLRTKLSRNTLPVSKKFGIGFYYDDTDEPKIFSAHEIKVALRRASIVELWLRKEAERKAAAKANLKKSLPGKYPHLTPCSYSDYATFRRNVLADLKHHFPGVKFSLKKRSYNCINISWLDGPSDEKVSKVTRQWVDHETDRSGDFRDYAPSVFNEVFGGMNYVFTHRDWSEGIEALKTQFPENFQDPGNTLYRIMRETSLPIGAYNFRLESTDISCGYQHEFYKIGYDVPENKKASCPTQPLPLKNISLMFYSEKSVVITGETKPIKDRLKELGGRFNFKLSCGPGWIFHKSQLPMLMAEFKLELCENK